ncbi:MAG: hypothetical protein A3J67_03030 [Parcubacteria group bacterium RIFCSPHIGHO2_02_FULL_48_10b]|nr:MAG: hypothetical protein A3J67_03030 [Parcubacteria group bacterium RIFCSPHIGHO2_02_FULL_48_10b]
MSKENKEIISELEGKMLDALARFLMLTARDIQQQEEIEKAAQLTKNNTCAGVTSSSVSEKASGTEQGASLPLKTL